MDNLTITSGSGLTISTDQDATTSAHYQRIKLVDADLNSSNATGVPVNPFTVNVSNTSATISVLNTSATISVLNTSATISVLNTGGSISVLNTAKTISILNTGGTISVLNTGANINVLNTRVTVAVSNTGGPVSILTSGPFNIIQLNTASGTNVNVLNTAKTISILNTSATISVLNTATTISVLNTGANINVLNTRVSVSVSGGVTLLSSIPLVVKRDINNYSGTWVYSALSSAVEVSVWTPAAGKKFNITDLTVNVLESGKVTLKQGVTGSTIMIVELANYGGWASNLQTPYASNSADSPLTVQCDSVGTSGYICVSGYES